MQWPLPFACARERTRRLPRLESAANSAAADLCAVSGRGARRPAGRKKECSAAGVVPAGPLAAGGRSISSALAA